MSTNVKPARKRKGRGCWIALLVLLVILAAAGGIGWSFVAREHQEAANVPLAEIDFGSLKDGVYRGAYAGGMYRWRANECDVTVANGKVTDIELVKSANVEGETPGAEMVYERVIAAQTLQVDVVSGATLTSNGYLKAVEDAVIQAQRN